MSADHWTAVVPANSTASHAVRGHVTREAAIGDAIRHARAEIGRYRAMLRDLEAGQVRVYQQTGLYKVKNRTELMP